MKVARDVWILERIVVRLGFNDNNHRFCSDDFAFSRRYTSTELEAVPPTTTCD